MGEEYGETNPFPFFCDFDEPELIAAVREGRKAEFAHFGWDQEPPDPVAASTRDMAVLSWSWETPDRANLRRVYKELLDLRRSLKALRDPHHARALLHADGASLEILRGGAGRDGGEDVSIVFNLSGSVSPIPSDLAGKRLVFRSEVPQEAGSSLSPHEFAIFSGAAGDAS